MGVFTTTQWKTSGRLVQELNVCTVLSCIKIRGQQAASRPPVSNLYLHMARTEVMLDKLPIIDACPNVMFEDQTSDHR